MKIHRVKCWPKWFQLILDGQKDYEIRFNDRAYAPGDLLCLHEWKQVGVTRPSDCFTGRVAWAKIRSVDSLNGIPEIPPCFVFMKIRQAEEHEIPKSEIRQEAEKGDG